MVQRVLLASPRGYCAGVERAVDTVEKLLDLHGPPVYVRKQIVHNAHVARDLEARGAVFGGGARARCAGERRWSSRPTASRLLSTRTRRRVGWTRSTRRARSSRRCTSRRGG